MWQLIFSTKCPNPWGWKHEFSIPYLCLLSLKCTEECQKKTNSSSYFSLLNLENYNNELIQHLTNWNVIVVLEIFPFRNKNCIIFSGELLAEYNLLQLIESSHWIYNFFFSKVILQINASNQKVLVIL